MKNKLLENIILINILKKKKLIVKTKINLKNKILLNNKFLKIKKI